jgi:hypothetical protein
MYFGRRRIVVVRRRRRDGRRPPTNIAPSWCQHLARSRAEWNRRKRNNSVTRRADAPTVYIRRAAVGSSSGSSVAIVGSFRS